MKPVFALAGALLALATCASPALAQTIIYPAMSAPLFLAGANTVEQRNGTNAQAFGVDNTYTDASNYERGILGWGTLAANRLYLGTQAAGTGSYRALDIAGNSISVYPSSTQNDGTGRWNFTSAMFGPNADNTVDIGASGANRPKNLYIAGTGVFGGALTGNGVISLTHCYDLSSRGTLCANGDGLVRFTNNAGTAASSIIGTTTNDNPASGGIGEYICAQVTNGGTPTGCATNTSTPVSLTSGANSDIVSVSLTAGDWKVCATLGFFPAGTTTVATLQGWTSTASATLPNFPNGGAYTNVSASFTTGTQAFTPVSCARYSLASTTLVYLTVRPGFGVSTMTGGGFLEAWRVR